MPLPLSYLRAQSSWGTGTSSGGLKRVAGRNKSCGRVRSWFRTITSPKEGHVLEATRYEAVERLPDGQQYEIRALKPADQDKLLAAVDQSSAQSLYRRFFFPKRRFTEDEIACFVNVDFVGHVALVAVLEDAGQNVIIGGCRYIVTGCGKAEVASVVVDRYQGQGVGTALLHHLAAIARAAGLKEL